MRRANLSTIWNASTNYHGRIKIFFFDERIELMRGSFSDVGSKRTAGRAVRIVGALAFSIVEVVDFVKFGEIGIIAVRRQCKWSTLHEQD